MVYNFFDRKSKEAGIKNEIKENQQLTNELHKPIIRKFRKRKVYPSFKDNIWALKKYKLFDVTKFILVLPTFRLKQQSLSRTRC